MQTLDQYIESRFKDVDMKIIYATQSGYDTLKEWIKRNCMDYTEYYGRYEQHMGRYPKGERNFYVASNRIVVEYSRDNFQERDFYENIRNTYYLLKYQIVVK